VLTKQLFKIELRDISIIMQNLLLSLRNGPLSSLVVSPPTSARPLPHVAATLPPVMGLSRERDGAAKEKRLSSQKAVNPVSASCPRIETRLKGEWGDHTTVRLR